MTLCGGYQSNADCKDAKSFNIEIRNMRSPKE